MSDTPVIYENPQHPLPEWARWMVKHLDDGIEISGPEPVLKKRDYPYFHGWDFNDMFPGGGRRQIREGYSIAGPWQDSLRRIVRLSDPTYYVPENPHTDSEGFLPCDKDGMPEWVRGKRIRIKFADGDVHDDYPGGLEYYWFKNNEEGVSPCVAYRIVGEQEEGDGCCDQPEQCWEPCGDLGKNAMETTQLERDFAKKQPYCAVPDCFFSRVIRDADELARLREGVRINAGHLSKEGLVEAADVFYELLNNGAKADAMIEREDSE